MYLHTIPVQVKPLENIGYSLISNEHPFCEFMLNIRDSQGDSKKFRLVVESRWNISCTSPPTRKGTIKIIWEYRDEGSAP